MDEEGPRAARRTREKAIKEAERLARLTPGAKFHVMQSVVKVHMPLPAKEPAAEAKGGAAP